MFFLFMMLFNQPQYEVVWDHQNVNIEVYDEVDAYTMLPEATLYKDGQIVPTTRITYERGVDRTFLSVLTSVELKTFYIKYRVHFLSYGVTDTVTIAFHIVDTTPPEVNVQQNIILSYGEKVNIKDYVTATDNYDHRDALKITFLDAQVNLDVLGDYRASVLAEDTSGNQTIVDVLVTIKDYIAPEIIQTQQVILEPFESLNIQTFFRIKDNVDQTVFVWIEDDLLNKGVLGIYEAKICARDSSLNQSCQSFYVEIKDTIAPVVVLPSQTITIEVYDVLSKEMMMDWFVLISDAYDQDNLNINFYHQLNTHVIGRYDVMIEVFDQSLNVTEKTFQVVVVDSTPPTVSLLTSTIHVFEPLKPLLSYVMITDNYDEKDVLSVKINSNINPSLLGVYQLDVEVSDLSKNKRQYSFLVEVVDLEAPKIDLEEAFIITDFMRPDYESRLIISDNYDDRANIDVMVDDEDVNYELPGMYIFRVELSDKSGNISVIHIDVIVVDIIPPVIELYEEVLTYELGYVNIDLRNNIRQAYDNISDIGIEDVWIDEKIDENKVGRYVVEYHVLDEANSKTTIDAYVFIQDTTPPVIETQTYVYQLGSPLSMYEDISVVDHSDVTIEMISKDLFEQSIGTYVVTYVAYDTSGNHTVFNREIVVEDTHFIAYIMPYQTSIIIMLTGILSAWLTRLIFRKKNFDKTLQFEYNEK